MSDFGDWTLIKSTRKDRKCTGCFDKLPTKSEAMYWAGKFQGDFQAFHLCLPCYKYLNENYQDFEDGWTNGDLGEGRREAEKNQKAVD